MKSVSLLNRLGLGAAETSLPTPRQHGKIYRLRQGLDPAREATALAGEPRRIKKTARSHFPVAQPIRATPPDWPTVALDGAVLAAYTETTGETWDAGMGRGKLLSGLLALNLRRATRGGTEAGAGAYAASAAVESVVLDNRQVIERLSLCRPMGGFRAVLLSRE